MAESSFASRYNLDAIEDAYARWQVDPAAVDESWRLFFEGFQLGLQTPALPPPDGRTQTGVVRLIDAYRDLGHFLANLDPLSEPKTSYPLLELHQFGLDESDLDRTFDTHYFVGLPAGDASRAAQGPPRNVLRQHRRRVHAHPGHGHPPLAPGANGAAP